MANKHPTRRVTLFSSAARTADTGGSASLLTSVQSALDTENFEGYTRSILLFLDVTAASGTTPTLDVKIQGRASGTGAWADIPAGAFSRKTTTVVDAIRVDGPLPPEIRGYATIGGTTPSFTFSLVGIASGGI